MTAIKIQHSKSLITSHHIESVKSTLTSGLTTAGKLNGYFGDLFSEYVNRKGIMLFSSGTAALYHLIKNLDLDKDAEILLPNYICPNILRALKLNRVVPVLYDNAYNQWVSGIKEIEDQITSLTKAIIINHTFGEALSYVSELQRKYPSIFIIEDCCHLIAPNSQVGSVEVSTSHASFYSFNSTKLLAGGEGGALFVRNDFLAARIKASLLDSGMSDITCSLLIAQLKDYISFNERRRQIARFYESELKNRLIMSNMKANIHFRFPTLVNCQAEMLQNELVAFRKGVDQLNDASISAQITLPNSKYIFDNTISIPIYPALKDSEVEIVVKTFNSYNDN